MSMVGLTSGSRRHGIAMGAGRRRAMRKANRLRRWFRSLFINRRARLSCPVCGRNVAIMNSGAFYRHKCGVVE